MIMTKQNEYFPQSVPHPGLDLSEKLEELELDPKEFATRTGISEKTISDILKGNISITAEMAEQFENVLRIPAHYWLNRQFSYDEYKIRVKS
jgi:addiction module HigA family antidote